MEWFHIELSLVVKAENCAFLVQKLLNVDAKLVLVTLVVALIGLRSDAFIGVVQRGEGSISHALILCDLNILGRFATTENILAKSVMISRHRCRFNGYSCCESVNPVSPLLLVLSIIICVAN